MRILIRDLTPRWETFVNDLKKREGFSMYSDDGAKNHKDFDLVLNLRDEGREAFLVPSCLQILKRGEGLLEGENKQMLEAIIYSAQDAISVVDENGIGILINPAYTKITGLTEEDVIGNPATVDIAEGESMHYKVLQTCKPVTGVPMKVGPKKKEVIVDVAPIIINGELKGSVGVIHDISEIKRLTEELKQANQMLLKLRAKYTFDHIIGTSPKMCEVIKQAKKASKTPATVLLRGESGTGKELFAHAIHNESSRNGGQFIRVNCPAIPDTLMESELFGYEGGAFTGARPGGKKGLFEEAHNGTIFLDEIAKIDFRLQDKLLRVLQEKEFNRVGGTEPINVDVRIIAATNAPLEKMVKEEKFREDLYYRLNVFPIFLPPLRDRKKDIPLLVHNIIRRFNQEYGRIVESCSPAALEILEHYDWPGNIRELENVIGRAMIEVDYNSKVITQAHLPPLGLAYRLWSETDRGRMLPLQIKPEHSLRELMELAEKNILEETLKRTSGNRQKAAAELNIAIRSLYYKIRRHGIS